MSEKCDFCEERAQYDARLLAYGTWAYVCQRHFVQFDCKLGVGFGQKLPDKEVKTNDNKGM